MIGSQMSTVHSGMERSQMSIVHSGMEGNACGAPHVLVAILTDHVLDLLRAMVSGIVQDSVINRPRSPLQSNVRVEVK